MLTILLLASVLQAPAEGTPVKFTTVARGTTSQIEEPRTAVIRTNDEWTTLWKAHAGDEKPPMVDFTQSMVIAVFSGTKPTAAHTVEISNIAATATEILVTYREGKPKADDMVAQMLTQPFHIVTTQARPGKVTFRPAVTSR
jgi:hypothetical protein